jgi:hypothetical protein
MSSIIDADTLLAVDVGSVNTRANLFDVVDGRYRLVATGRAPTTAGAPLFDIGEGVRLALDKVQRITGRRFIDESEALIMPVTNEGVGVDMFVATTTTGPKVRTVLVGLMPGVSMESIKRVAASSYLDVIAEISLMDRRREEEQIDVILSARPDLFLVPMGEKPRVVYAGNQQLGALVQDLLGDQHTVALTSNVRPSIEHEDLAPARLRLNEVIDEVRAARVSGFDELHKWSGGHLMLSAEAFGRVVRYLSQIYSPDKGVLGIDLGSSQTTIAAAFDGALHVSVQSDIGMGTSSTGVLDHGGVAEIMHWLPMEMPESSVRDYIHNKALYPGTIATMVEELHLEYAIARQAIRSALSTAMRGWPSGKSAHTSWLMPALEPIIASGAVLARAPHPGYAALVLLDAVQPTGISTLVLDPHNLTPSLGVASGVLPIISVQVLESGSYVSLGTVVAPIGRSRIGRRIMRLRLEREGTGEDISGEVRMGQLVVLPLALGEQARLTLRPERAIDVGFGGPGRAGTLRVAGGAAGLIIDARGRPIILPKDPERQRELNQKWLWDIGAME